MLNSSTNKLLLLIFFISLVSAFSTNSVLWIWLFMEVNTLVIVPIFFGVNTLQSSQNMMIFFFYQAVSSNLMLVIFILTKLSIMIDLLLMKTIFMAFIMLKMGLAPFYMWTLKLVESMKWMPLFLFLTFQKIIPMIFIILFISQKVILLFVLMNSFMGCILGLNQLSIRKLMIFSSLNHMSWLFLSISYSMKLTKLYFMFYMIISFFNMSTFQGMKINYLYDTYMVNSFMLLSKSVYTFKPMLNVILMMSIPPMMGFLPKLSVIMNMSSTLFIIVFSMILLSLLSVFFYMRINISYNLNSFLVSKTLSKNVFYHEFQYLNNFLFLFPYFFIIHKWF